MQSSAAARPSLRKPNGGNGRLSGTAKVVKRDGTEVPYDPEKITQAIISCFLELVAENPDFDSDDPQWAASMRTEALAVTEQVSHLLPFEEPPISVERIQDLVEQQLMATGHHEAAKAYILYREEHRKLRERTKVDEETKAAFAKGCGYFDSPAQVFQAFDKFARFDYQRGRREIWPETVARVMKYTITHIHEKFGTEALTLNEWSQLKEGLLRLQASPAMRVVQMAGPALERCQTGVFNCSFQFLRGPADLAEELYLLMQGCGVGFSVEYQHSVDKWPRVKKQKRVPPTQMTIPDTTEGWCDAYRTGIEHWLDGRDIEFDFSEIRPEGAILKTKGGRSSGPQPLKDVLAFARTKILARQGDRLTSLDLQDINCYAHRIVQMGGVRRASGISLSDLDDNEIRDCKKGQFWDKNPQRNQSNNSAVYLEKPDAVEFMEEWLALAKSGTGERGIFNRGALKQQFPARRKATGHLFGTNPCGEIILRHKQFCNLSIAVLHPEDSWAEVREKVRLAAVWGTLQSTMTNFKYVSEEWKRNVEEECLLGVDLLGHLDHPLLQPGAEGIEQRLEELRDLAVETNRELAERLGVNPSAAVTCGKPAGNSSVFFGTAAGFKAYHGKHYVRRFRATPGNPVAKMLRDQGVPCVTDYDGSGLVLEFPMKAPEGAILLGDQTAIEQLEHWRTYKLHYTEHNPSVTIYVKEEEWLEVGHWVYANWDIVGGLSFSPFDGGDYPLAPYGRLSEKEYEERVAAMPDVDWSQLVDYEDDDMTEASHTFACTGDACAV